MNGNYANYTVNNGINYTNYTVNQTPGRTDANATNHQSQVFPLSPQLRIQFERIHDTENLGQLENLKDIYRSQIRQIRQTSENPTYLPPLNDTLSNQENVYLSCYNYVSRKIINIQKTTLQLELGQKNQLINNTQAENQELKNENIIHKEKNEKLEEEINIYFRTIETQFHDITKFNEQNEDLTNQNNNLSVQNNKLFDQMDELNSNNEKLTDRNVKLTEKNEELNSINGELRDHITTLSEVNDELNSNNQELSNYNATLIENNKEITSNNEKLTEQNGELSKELSDFKNTFHEGYNLLLKVAGDASTKHLHMRDEKETLEQVFAKEKEALKAAFRKLEAEKNKIANELAEEKKAHKLTAQKLEQQKRTFEELTPPDSDSEEFSNKKAKVN